MADKVKNRNLTKAKNAKQDEFYTQLADIERELKHYKDYFRGKVVLCNCDDPDSSNFTTYFRLNAAHLGIKRLIVVCYRSKDASQFSQNNSDQASWIEYSNPVCGYDEPDRVEMLLREDGDFRSKEGIAILKQADIVVTNPPFSLFREYVAQLVEYDKKFLIIGSMNAITYKETFTLIQANKMWLGYNSGDMKFKVPHHYEARDTRYWEDEDGQKWRSLGNTCWFTNLDTSKRHEGHTLYKTYTPEDYPKYDNYDAINVDKVADIPADYYGVMGVPITFLDKFNPAQFEILGIANSARWIGYECLTILDGRKVYNRIIIKRRHQS